MKNKQNKSVIREYSFSKFVLFVLLTAGVLGFGGKALADNYIVTNLNDSGVGSLRYGVDNAPAEGRNISFTGLGPANITLVSTLRIDQSNIIIDGLTADDPITIKGAGWHIRGDGDFPIDYTQGKNIIIRGLRFRNPSGYDDSIWIRDNANDVTIEYCSFSDNVDGMIDITQGSYNVEIRYNMFIKGGMPGNNLIALGARKVSFHHNLSYASRGRQPQLSNRPCESYTDCEDFSTELRGDVRYNIVWNHRDGTKSEDSRSNYMYNLWKAEDGWPPSYFFINNDANPNGGDTYVTEVHMVGNACVTDCRNLNLGVTGANYHNNHAEFPFDLTASGAVWPDKLGIVAEWQDTVNNAGLINTFPDDADEAEARTAVIIPDISIFNEERNENLTEDTTPPTRSNPQPTGTLTSGTTSTIISLTTNETAICKYSANSGTNYDLMTLQLSSGQANTHTATVSDLEDGNSYTYYIRCQDESNNQNPDDFEISFSVASHIIYNISNFINLVTDWLKSESGLESDVNGDGVVNTRDLGIMMSNWSE